MNSVKDAIKIYKTQLVNSDISYNFFDFSDIAEDLKLYFESGIFFVERTDSTSSDIFKNEMGYSLPDDICNYINSYWQPGVFGYYKSYECIVLFPVVRYVNDTSDTILLQKNGLINTAKQWRNNFKGDINKYLPIGYLGYSGMFVLYEVTSGKIFLEDIDNDGFPEKEALTDSLRELILKLRIN